MVYSDANDSIGILSADFVDFDTQELAFDNEAQGYVFSNKVGESPATKAIAINLNISQTVPDENGNVTETSSIVNGRLLTYSIDSGFTQHIALLATKAEICSSNFADLRVSTAWDRQAKLSLLDIINQINLTDDVESTAKPKIVCN